MGNGPHGSVSHGHIAGMSGSLYARLSLAWLHIRTATAGKVVRSEQ